MFNTPDIITQRAHTSTGAREYHLGMAMCLVKQIRDGSYVEFLGQKVDVGDADDEDVDKFCKDIVVDGFWKTITKLNDSIYLSTKSVFWRSW